MPSDSIITLQKIFFLKVSFMDWWRGDEENGRIVSCNGRVGEDISEIFSVLVERHILTGWT